MDRIKKVKKLSLKFITLVVVAALDNPVTLYFVVDIRLVLDLVLLSLLLQQVLHNEKEKKGENESSE